ncbi:hypothetical protein F5Y02DRAFT_424014 [Annulohypoxylon stygium]|nr:hypothetical protein F5Y02DRAFT_424014 [Annulohypoxylon stygium]
MSNSKVKWQAVPTERGTLTLVYSCLLTVFTCTWTVLHLNMVVTILFPEFMFVKAIQDLRLALNNLRDFDNELQSKYGGEIKWTNIYNEFAHTYSWKVDYDPRANLLYLIMGLEPPLDQGRSVETNAKLEGDIVSRGRTIIMRAAGGLPVTQLEIATAAFSVFAITTYAANWLKPKDVSRPIRMTRPAYGRVWKGHAFRVPNDVTGVEEGVPLIFGIMAVSSAVFGGVHLVTWDFEFPSRGANPVEGERCRVHDTSLNLARAMFEPLRAFPASFCDRLKDPDFLSWDTTERYVLYSAPTGSHHLLEISQEVNE